MSRLIDADKLKKDVLDLPNCYNGFSDTYDKACIIGVIDEQPTIEPERKKEKWIRLTNDLAQCSECEDYIDNAISCGYNYCPNCGAEMSE